MIIQGFKGIHNTVPPRSIPDNALVDAVDVDIDDFGALHKREGYTLKNSFTSIGAAYATSEQVGYVVDSGILYISERGDDAIAVVDNNGNVIKTTATEFTDFGNTLFTNDGFKVNANIAVSLNIKTPITAPNIIAGLVDSALETGFISSCYCYKSLVSGLMSGSSPISTVEVNLSTGIEVLSPEPPEGYEVIVFKTDFNGEVYYSELGFQLNPINILAAQFPDNVTKVAFHRGRLWLSSELSNDKSIIWKSHPAYYHLYDKLGGYIIIPGQIRAMVSNQNQLLIGTDSAIYAYGDSLVKLANYGVPDGRPFSLLPDGAVIILSNRGICSALPFKNLTEDKLFIDAGNTCSTAIINDNNGERFIAINNSALYF